MKENREVTDTNVGDIEEARERLEKRIKDIWFSTTYSQEQEEKDLKILLSDYKRVLKINEVLLKENEEWQKAYQEEKDSQFNLIKENQMLKSFLSGIFNENIEKDFIPVQKVKDKIEELNRKIDKSIDNSKGGLDEEFIEKAGELLAQKRILQELIEGRK